jgi:drug/metabolite transporter (DMT)-like permease
MNLRSVNAYRQRAIAQGAAVASALAMGTLGFFVRQTSAAPIVVAFARLGLGLGFLTAFIAASGRLSAISFAPGRALVGSGLALGVCIGSYVAAIDRLSLANAAFLLYTGPLVAVVLARIALHERVGAARAALVLAAFAGFVCIVATDLERGTAELPGLLFGALAGLAYATMIVTNRAIRPRVPPLGRAFYQLMVATLALAPLVPWRALALSFVDLAWLGAIGLIHGFLALTLMIFAFRRLPAHEYGVLAQVEPLTAMLVGWGVFGESLTLLQAVGGGIIVASGLALHWYGKTRDAGPT